MSFARGFSTNMVQSDNRSCRFRNSNCMPPIRTVRRRSVSSSTTPLPGCELTHIMNLTEMCDGSGSRSQTIPDQDRLLLDVEIDAFQLDGRRTNGGQGDPILLDQEVFLAIAHPAGINEGIDSGIRLWHSPGTKIQPGQTLKSEVSVIGVTPRNQVLDHFHRYMISLTPSTIRKTVSIYTCFGINNQWGTCPGLTDVERLDIQRVVKSWQEEGVKFDYFTVDWGWADNDGDLTQFTSACYPEGPGKIVAGAEEMGAKLGLWFSVSDGSSGDGSYPPIQTSAILAPGSSGVPPTSPRTGLSGWVSHWIGCGRPMCIASDPYFNVFKNAVEYHLRQNHVRLVKLDIGNYYCNSTVHQHLPGRYSTEAMFNRLIEVARSVRAISPDVSSSGIGEWEDPHSRQCTET